MKNRSLIIAIVLIAVAAISRLLPHPYNFSPVGSLAMFGGAVLASKYLKYLVPIIALFISDLVLNNTLMRGFYPEDSGLIIFQEYMISTYIAFILAVVIGHLFIKKISISSVLGGAIGFTIVFFLITNFGSWLDPVMPYPKTLSGLGASYLAGLPFLKFTLAGNILYSAIIFSIYHFSIKEYKAVNIPERV